MSTEPILERLDDLLEEANSPCGFPALAAAVASRGGIMAAGAIGVRKVGSDSRVTLEDRFHVGSVAKPMAATVLATIVEEGRLTWDSTPQDVFPELDAVLHPALRDIRLTHLLSHRAGIAPFEQEEERAQLPPFGGSPRDQRRAFAEWLLRREPAVPPGSADLYSNAGYAIVAAMAERVMDQPWESLCRNRLFAPLDLQSAGFGWPAKDHPDEPWGHYKTAQGLVPHPPDDVYQLGPLLVPAGDIHASILDLARFGRMHLLGLTGADTLIRASTMHVLHTPVGKYGLGWYINESGHQHAGSAETFVAMLLLRAQQDRVYAYATNAADAEGHESPELRTQVVTSLVHRFEREGR